MSDARAAILARIRDATRDVDVAEAPAWTPPAGAGPRRAPPPGDLADLLAARIADYAAQVTRVAGPDDLPATLGAICARHGASRLAVPPGLPGAWRPGGVELVADDPPLEPRALAALDGALTGCALAIAQTGTIVLDAGRRQGRRALTLLPDLHVCVVEAGQIVSAVPDAIGALAGTDRPITFVSGPSATSDIELERVEGVHGPRRLEVVLVAG